jgi:hypothetical protein
MDSMLNMVAEAVVMEITLEVLSLVQAVVAAAPRAVHGADMQSVVVVRQEQAVAQEP